MGPTIIALVRFFHADQQVRAAQGRYDEAGKELRIQQRKLAEVTEQQRLTNSKLMEQQSALAQLELDIKTRDAHIERLRTQQQTAKNNKEYQAYLVEINTEKVEKGKVEELTLQAMEQVETISAENKQLQASVATEQEKLDTIKAALGGKLTVLQKEIDALKPARDAAALEVPAKALDAFSRLADKFEGQGVSALTKPDRKRELYACQECNMDLVTDVYNKLHSRDELVFCPSCHRILYIPDDLPLETAVHVKIKKDRKPESAETTS